MAEPTVSRATLRRAIAREMHMPFARIRGDTSTFTGTPTSGKLFDSSMKQPDGYWDGHFMYVASSAGNANGEVRRILKWLRSTQVYYPEFDFSAAPSSGDTYEIHSVWSATDIHDAINRAIDMAYPKFFDVSVDENLVVREDTLEYDLSSITNLARILQIWIERTSDSMMGTAQAGGASTITAAAGTDLSQVNSNWKVSIYAGTGAGQVRSVSSADNGTKVITVSTAWTTQPNNTSKYKLWNASEQTRDWYKTRAVRFDSFNHPSKMYLGRNFQGLYGSRFRIIYTAKPASLTADSGAGSTTVVPREYIVPKAMSLLYLAKINDNRYDRARFDGLSRMLNEQAERFARENAHRQPAETMWSLEDRRGGFVGDTTDPLGWRS